MIVTLKLTRNAIGVTRGILVLAVGASPLCAQIVPAAAGSLVLQPPAYAIGLSSNSTSGGQATWLDNTGIGVALRQPIASNPLGFAFDPTGTYAEALNSEGTMNFFSATFESSGGNTYFDTNSLGYNTLPTPGCTSNLFSASAGVFAFDIKNSEVDAGLSVGTGTSAGLVGIGPSLQVPLTPITMTGASGATRYTVISQNVPYGVACNNIAASVSASGTATVVDISGAGLSSWNKIPLGRCPVYGVTSTDGNRSFVLNRGDDTVTVINVPGANLDTTINLDAGQPITTHSGPVHAEYVPRTSKLVVANYDNDTVSIIDVALYNRGVDTPSFGKVTQVDLWNGVPPPVVNGVAQVKHPAAITVLPDGSLAYVADQSYGTVDVVDLRLGEVVSTITLTPLTYAGFYAEANHWTPDPNCPNVANPTLNLGGCIHPRELAVIANSTTNSVNANVYVGSPDSPIFTFIDAESNSAFAFEQQQIETNTGNMISLAVDTQLAPVGLNNLFATRLPGAGQPCYLPNPAPANLAACQSH